MEIVKSVSKSDVEIIKGALKLHVPQGFIDLDPTYSTGVFYKNNPEIEPRLKSDLIVQSDGVIQADFTDLHFVEDDSLNCIVFDPPFVMSGKTYKESKDGSCNIPKRFGLYGSWDELKDSYFGAMLEFKRVLKRDGVLIFKCQDAVVSGKNHMTHSWVMNVAVELGLYPKDLFIKLAASKMTSFGARWKRQVHAMKYHSYWWVFVNHRIGNRKNKVNYETKNQK